MIEVWAVRFGKKDIVSGLITLPILLVTGIAVTFASFLIGGSSVAALNTPSTAIEWIVLCFACMFLAYLEESYFRFYLLTKREELNLTSVSALALSAALFSICHIYGGPWIFLNAVISGVFLGFIFLRYNSLHGIAIAHGMYNISVYIIYAVLKMQTNA
jgi:membrane protease YdiL (CAAX protease family)